VKAASVAARASPEHSAVTWIDALRMLQMMFFFAFVQRPAPRRLLGFRPPINPLY
jgi:hypothetical protein